MLNLQHQHNNHTTTPHMRVDPTHWSPLSCEELLCGCCDGVVYESNPYFRCGKTNEVNLKIRLGGKKQQRRQQSQRPQESLSQSTVFLCTKPVEAELRKLRFTPFIIFVIIFNFFLKKKTKLIECLQLLIFLVSHVC
jgi:hypothetical protein